MCLSASLESDVAESGFTSEVTDVTSTIEMSHTPMYIHVMRRRLVLKKICGYST